MHSSRDYLSKWHFFQLTEFQKRGLVPDTCGIKEVIYQGWLGRLSHFYYKSYIFTGFALAIFCSSGHIDKDISNKNVLYMRKLISLLVKKMFILHKYFSTISFQWKLQTQIELICMAVLIHVSKWQLYNYYSSISSYG